MDSRAQSAPINPLYIFYSRHHRGQCEKGGTDIFYMVILGTGSKYWANRVPITTLSTPAPKDALSVSASALGIGSFWNHLYALANHQEYMVSLDIGTGMFKLFSHDVYYFLDLESSLIDVISFVAMHFGVGP